MIMMMNPPAKPAHNDARCWGRAVVEGPNAGAVSRALQWQQKRAFARAMRRADKQRTELRHVVCWRIEQGLKGKL